MSIRKEKFVTGEIYHCYNRGVDKRSVFTNKNYFDYFLKINNLFNHTNSLGGVKEYLHNKNKNTRDINKEKLVTILAYCINPNHYHLLLQQKQTGGISRFMQKIGTGYTMYFNKHENRTGSLFQGKFKSKYVDSDEYLKYLSVYVSRNNEIHNITNKSKFRSSFKLHITNTKDQVCDPSFILSLFDEGEYIKFSNQALKNIREQKDLHREIEFRSQ